MVPLDRSYNIDYFWSAIVSIDHVDRAIDQQDRSHSLQSLCLYSGCSGLSCAGADWLGISRKTAASAIEVVCGWSVADAVFIITVHCRRSVCRLLVAHLPSPVRQRIVYKTAVLVWKCLHSAAPRYLADLCVPAHSVRGRQQLRSTASGTLLVPRARTATGQCSFAVNGPRTWNSLPANLRTPDTTLCSFKRHLTAHLFQQ